MNNMSREKIAKLLECAVCPVEDCSKYEQCQFCFERDQAVAALEAEQEQIEDLENELAIAKHQLAVLPQLLESAGEAEQEPVATLLVSENGTSASYKVTGFRVDALSCVPLGAHDLFLTAPPRQAEEPAAWQPISTAPKGPGKHQFMMLRWEQGGESCSASGIRFGDKFFAASVFYRGGSHESRQYAFREHEVTPTHWMPAPWDAAPPAQAAAVPDAVDVLRKIKAWDVDNYMTLPHEIRAPIQSVLDSAPAAPVTGEDG